MDHFLVLNIDSIDKPSISAKIENSNTGLTLTTADESIAMAVGTEYGPFTKYFATKYPNDHTTYPGGQVSIILDGQQCGPATNNYVTVLFLGSDEHGSLNEAWAFNVSMTPAAPRSGSRAQFATYTAAYGSYTTTPNVNEVMAKAMEKGAQIKLVKKGVINTWTFENGQCFQINFNIKRD